MIKEISVRPKPQNNNAKLLTVLFGIGAIIGFVAYFMMSRFELPYKSLVGLLALCLLVTAIMLMTKYVFPFFCYDVTFDHEGTPILVVRQVTGKRERTLSRISLADIASLNMENRAERRAHKTPIGIMKYSYMPTLSPEISARLEIKSRYEKAEVQIEVSEEFLEMLRSYVAEAKALRQAEEDREEY